MRLLQHWKQSIAFAAVIAISCAGTIYAQVWANSGKPKPIVVHHIKLEKQPNNSHLLIVTASGPPTQDCLRLTQHLLIRQAVSVVIREDNNLLVHENKKLRNYVPLGAAVNGMGFSTDEDFDVTLEIPAAIPGGRWEYVNRSVYFCVTPPGLVTVTQAKSAEQMITLD